MPAGAREAGRPERETLATAVLEVLSDRLRPIGSSLIHEQLLASGHRVSEPTVGRILRDLDRIGLTTGHGHQGRTLTSRGRRQVDVLRDQRHRSGHVQAMVDNLRADSLDEILDLLAARRGVEREIARAAAVNATRRDLADMRAGYESMREGRSYEGLHEILARASHNPVLESLYGVLTRDPAIARAVNRIASQRGQLVDVRFNQRLLSALAKKDPDAAERVVVDHLDELITTVREYWKLAGTRAGSRRTAGGIHGSGAKAT